MIRAKIEVGNVVFEAFAATKEKSLDLLRRAWLVAAAQHGSDDDVLDEYGADIEFCDIREGAVYQDGKEMLLN